jgi:hypothetical protein
MLQHDQPEMVDRQLDCLLLGTGMDIYRLLRLTSPRDKCLAGTLEPSSAEQIREGEGRVPLRSPAMRTSSAPTLPWNGRRTLAEGRRRVGTWLTATALLGHQTVPPDQDEGSQTTTAPGKDSVRRRK